MNNDDDSNRVAEQEEPAGQAWWRSAGGQPPTVQLVLRPTLIQAIEGVLDLLEAGQIEGGINALAVIYTALVEDDAICERVDLAATLH